MSADGTSNDDLDPTAFVKRIRELSERHEREDAERLSSIEADIEKGRSERAARRAERARSLSPDKTFSPSIASPKPLGITKAPTMDLPSPSTSRSGTFNSTPDKLTSTTESERPESPPKSASSLARSGTLSWQQRPSSGSIRRPLSVASRASVVSDKRASVVSGKPAEESAEPTRNQIAEALGSKDPSWFKQTADRGVGNAAFRRNQDEPEADSVRKFGLPGMSRPEAATGSADQIGGATSPPPDSFASSSPSRGSAAWSNRISTATSNSTYSTTDQKQSQSILDPPKLDPSTTTEPASSARSPSPTRGMGGFVQSAMMKRSDSVNKRWSAQQGGSLHRQNSSASTRTGISGLNSMPRLDQAPESLSRESSAEVSSRPSSSYSNQTITHDGSEQKMDDGFARPPLPQHTRSKSTLSLTSASETVEDSERSASPSKRWSPTKSSWLENAINRPESPRAASPVRNQPSWMAELNKSKQQKANGSISVSPDLKGQSAESPPMKVVAMSAEQTNTDSTAATARTVSGKTAVMTPSLASKAKSPPPETKPKPEMPSTKDFRANLKPREPPKQAGDQSEPEFRNALGNLRRAETKNYKAPETFTNNIKAGKAALNVTGGVPERVRRDELKESLVAQKEAMKAKKTAEPDKPTSGVAVAPKAKPDMPEFLAARQKMGGKPPVGSEAKQAAMQSPLDLRSHLRTTSKDVPTRANVSAGAQAENRMTAREVEGFSQKPPISTSATPSQSAAPSKAIPSAFPANAPSALRSGVSTKLADRFNPGLASMLARGPPPSTGTKPNASVIGGDDFGSASLSRTESSEKKDSGQLEHMTKGRARGPKRRAPTTKPASSSGAPSSMPQSPTGIRSKPMHFRKVSLVKQELVLGSNAPIKVSSEEEEALKPVAILGEREDTAAQKRIVSPQLDQIPDASSIGGFEFGFGEGQNSNGKSANGRTIIEPETSSGSAPQRPYASTSKGGTASFAEQIAQRAGGSPHPVPSSSIKIPSETVRNPNSVPLKSQHLPASIQGLNGSPVARSPSPSKSPVRPASPEKAELSNSPSVRSAAAMWGRTAQSPAVSSLESPKSPMKLPGSRTEEPATPVSLSKRNLGLGLHQAEDAGKTSSLNEVKSSQRQQEQNPLSTPSKTTFGAQSPNIKPKPSSPAVGFKSPASGSIANGQQRARPPSIVLKSVPKSSLPQLSEASKLFSDFFGHSLAMPHSIDVDTQSLITNNPVDLSKVRTTRKQIHEIASDGKTSTLPANEEYTLFEGSMYTIAHYFERPTGSKATTAYLWVGNDVSPSAAEDVQVFAKRFAKDHKTILEIVRQGKESPALIDALGGILITRRGSRSSCNSTQQFMLCGRRHLGHIAFDEVEFSLRSFSSGFPFLAFANGKLYLWKGAGSTVEEVSCARLIAMDIGITPDVIEIDEGKESSSFISLFPSPEKGPKKIFPSADHWQRKSNSDRYRTRLFHVSATTPQYQQQGGFQTPTMHSTTLPTTPSSPNTAVSVNEIAPYAQRDMEGKEGVFVLDAFFEIYIILTSQSRSSPNAFTAALLFAQDYGILAASLEDRPFVPVSTVIVEGAPRDFKACFRQWDDSRWTVGDGSVSLSPSTTTNVKRGKSLKVIGLDEAIAAAMIQ